MLIVRTAFAPQQQIRGRNKVGTLHPVLLIGEIKAQRRTLPMDTHSNGVIRLLTQSF